MNKFEQHAGYNDGEIDDKSPVRSEACTRVNLHNEGDQT